MRQVKWELGYLTFLYYIYTLFRSLITHLALFLTLLIIGPIVLIFLLFFKKKFPTTSAFIWSLIVCAVGGVEIEIEGRHNVIRDKPQVIVANHQSSFDIHALIIALYPFFYRFVAKKELSYIPIFGWALYLADFPLVDRKNNEQAINALKRVEKILIKKNLKVVIFPEGTRNKGDGLLPFKKGAFVLALNTKCEIVPCVITGAKEVQKHHGFFIKPGTIKVKFLKRIDTKDFTYEKRDALVDKVYNVMLEELNKKDG